MRTRLTQKLCLFWPTLAGGGVERIGLRIAQAMSRIGYRVEVVVSSAVGELSSRVPSDLSLVDLGVKLGRGRLTLAIGPLARYLRERKPDVLWSHMTEANVVSIIASRISGFRGWHILSEHSTLGIRIQRQFRKLPLPLAARVLYPLAQRVHAVSTGVADDFARVTGLKRSWIQVIPNPVVDPSIYIEAEERLDHPWFEPGQPPVILGVGRLVPAKDFKTLILAFAQVRKELPARLVILGEGPERNTLSSLIRNMGLEGDVSLPGFVKNPYKYMKRAAVFVLSSQWEGLPTVLIEAMALGTPVVSTDCPSGPDEILEHGKWGVLVPRQDPDALAAGILKTIKFPNLARLEGAIERARDFSVGRVVERYVKELLPS